MITGCFAAVVAHLLRVHMPERPDRCSTEQGLDIQVETPSFGKIQVWSRNQTAMNPTTHKNSLIPLLILASMALIRRSDGPPS